LKDSLVPYRHNPRPASAPIHNLFVGTGYREFPMSILMRPGFPRMPYHTAKNLACAL
jgi:hypothetical protein